MNRKKSTFLWLFTVILCMFCVVGANFNTKIFADGNTGGIFDIIFGNPEPAVGEYVNNMYFLNFKGEETDANPFSDVNHIMQDATMKDNHIIDMIYNSGSFSLNKFYNQVSNGKLNIKTPIGMQNDKLTVYTLNQTREYFMPYYIKDNTTQEYIKNTSGYFPFEIVESTTPPASEYDIQFYLTSTHKFFVYDDTNLNLSDSDTTDTIIPLSQAQNVLNGNSKYRLVMSVEKYLRELQLLSYITEKITLDPVLSDVNNDGNIDILNFNFLKNPKKNYNINWNELLWAHQSQIDFVFNYKITLPIIGETTLTELVKNPLFSVFKSTLINMIAGHMSAGKVGATNVLDSIVNRPSVSKDGVTKNVDKYFLTEFDYLSININSVQNIYNSCNISTVAHELGHLLGLPDLYVYSKSVPNYVNSWSLMCYNGIKPQYFSAFERMQLGWLDKTSNVKSIESAGTYTLDVTKGYDNDKTVAYYIAGTGEFKNQYFYFEYRNKHHAENGFEGAIGRPGLLVYRVDTKIFAGNMYAEKDGHQIEVFSKNGNADYNATFVSGDVFGNSDLSETVQTLTYQNKANRINSGIVIEVISSTDESLTFNISYKRAVTIKDNNLKERLLSLCGETELNSESLKNLSVVDLSEISLNSLDELNHFEFKDNAILDISGCDFVNVDSLNLFLSENKNVKIIAVKNPFTLELANKITNRSEVVLGIPTQNSTLFRKGETNISEVVLFNDYLQYFDIYMDGNFVNSINFASFGAHVITLKPKISNLNTYDYNFDVVGYQKVQSIINLSYDDVFVPTLNLFNTYGENEQFKLNSNINALTLNRVGIYILSVDILYNNELIGSEEFEIHVTDKVAPVITLDGKEIIYITNASEYNKYANDAVRAIDAYDGEVAVNSLIPEMLGEGNYTVKYSAMDSSGNIAIKERHIVWGSFNINEANLEYNVGTKLPVVSYIFQLNDFDIFYKVNQESYIKYLANSDMIFDTMGDFTFDVKFISKRDSDFVFYTSKDISVNDTLLPVLTLKGDSRIVVNINSDYEDKGVAITDNSSVVIEKTIFKNNTMVDKIETKNPGEYIIKYTATDLGNNVVTVTRTVVVDFKPIKNIIIVEPSNANYDINKDFSLKLSILDVDDTNPDITVIWFVNGEQYALSNKLSYTFNFKEYGEYKITASIVNSDAVCSIISVNILKAQVINMGMLIGIIVAVGIVLLIFIIYFINRRRNKYFY